MVEIIGDVAGYSCIIVDDIVDTGNTLCKAAELLIQKGAISVEVFVTHGVLSGAALANINNSAITKITVTNSIEQTDLGQKFSLVDIVPLLVTALKNCTHQPI